MNGCYAAALVLMILTGCNGGEAWNDPGPRESFDAFLVHWYRGEAQQAFAYILPEDREVLIAPRENMQGRVPDHALPEPHEMLVMVSVDNVYDIARMELDTELEEAPEKGRRVTLLLHHQDGTVGQATMVWGGDRWYVDLPLDAQPRRDEDEK